ncbi:hypothetical protein WJX84_011284, partial [Apatococcus fuscideae]
EQPDGGEFFFSPDHLSLLQHNVNAGFHRKCSEHYPDEPWRCFYAADVWPHVETPLLFHHCLYDFHVRSYLLGENTTASRDFAQWERIRASYISSFRLHEQQTAAMSRTERMVLQTSQPKARLPNLFSPACTFHQMSDADFLTASSQVGQLLFLEVFKDWFLGVEEEVFIVDTHPGVRHQRPPPDEDMWAFRTKLYFDFADERKSLGLPADIYQTEPEFLMQPLVPQPAEIPIPELSLDPLGAEERTDKACAGSLEGVSRTEAARHVQVQRFMRPASPGIIQALLLLATIHLIPRCASAEGVPYSGTAVGDPAEAHRRGGFPGRHEALQNAELREEFSDWFQSNEWHQHYNVDFERIKMWRRLTTVEDADAVCNDGTPGVFYVRPGQGQGSKRWVIRAQGSQYCWNPQICADRWNGFAWFLMTSNHTREWISNTEHDVKGVFDFFLKAFGAINVDPILNPLWHNWNHVYIWSCSSDAFMGDAPGYFHEDSGPWPFRGRRIAKATMNMLLDNEGLDEATDVLVVGDSTGGVATMQMIDDLHAQVVPRMPNLKRFKGWIDGGWFFDAPTYTPDEFYFSPQRLGQWWWYTNASFDGSCAEHYKDEPWLCFYAPNSWPHVEVPLLFHECLYDLHIRDYVRPDAKQGQWDDLRNNMAASYRLHEEQYAAMTHTERMALQTGDPRSRLPVMFSPACKEHEISDADHTILTSHIGRLRFTDVMKAWFMGEVDELFVVDKHPGVRYFGLLDNEDQFLQRVLAWFEMRHKYRATLKNGQEPEDAIAAPLSSLERQDLTDADRLRMTAVRDAEALNAEQPTSDTAAYLERRKQQREAQYTLAEEVLPLANDIQREVQYAQQDPGLQLLQQLQPVKPETFCLEVHGTNLDR